MNYEKVLVILTLLGILLILLLANSKQIHGGKISSIQFSKNKITIQLKNQTFIIFTQKPLPLKKGDNISYLFKKSLYKGKNQKIIQKIWKY